VRRLADLAPVACGLANFGAAVALALVIAPATPLVPDMAERERYVVEHLAAWRASWLIWMVAAATLLWMYAWWRGRIRASRTPLVVAGIGIIADWSAELLLIFGAYADVAPLAFFLTGAIANGLYTVAGVQLTLATPFTPVERAYAAFMWSAGLMLTAGAILGIPIVTAIATGELFVLFCPWCVWLWRRLR